MDNIDNSALTANKRRASRLEEERWRFAETVYTKECGEGEKSFRVKHCLNNANLKYWCLWKDKCESAHTCVLQWTLGKQISLTRHGNSHLLPLCFCVAKYLKNVLVFLSHRQSYTQELYHAIKVNTNKIWYGNTCGKDFQIKWRLHSHWLIHVASSFQNGSSLWSRQFVKVWKGVTFVAAVRSL